MINALNEIEKICKKYVANTNVISETEGEGIKCLINHGSGVKKREIRSAKIWDFHMRITVRDNNENWRTVLKALLGIARDLTDNKEHKWIVGDIENNDSASDYSLSISLTVPYHPGD